MNSVYLVPLLIVLQEKLRQNLVRRVNTEIFLPIPDNMTTVSHLICLQQFLSAITRNQVLENVPI